MESSCLRTGFGGHRSSDFLVKKGGNLGFRVCSVLETLQFKERESPSLSLGKSSSSMLPDHSFVRSAPVNKPLKWWEKSLQPNMIEIQSAQHLVDSLQSFGDRLVVVHFYSPGCGGCKSLHPKICQLAELNPNTIFLKVNHDIHKPICYALHVHVLPFFRFYKGADGKVCSFSCTNATIKKFKDALATHTPEKASFFGPGKGLEECELDALNDMGLISVPVGDFIGSLAMP